MAAVYDAARLRAAAPDDFRPVRDDGGMTEANRARLRVLEAQLRRMRGMHVAYSSLFFRQITVWGVLCVALLALSTLAALAPAAAAVPFVVPFAFLEAGYSLYHVIFARRHAEFLERAIDRELGSDALVAHRLEAAYFTPLDAPKIALFSLARPAGFPSAMTLGYTAAAALLWGAGMDSTLAQVAAGGLPPVVPVLAGAWSLVVAAYLVWHFLARRDEERLLLALRASYGDGVGSPRRPRRSRRRR